MVSFDFFGSVVSRELGVLSSSRPRKGGAWAALKCGSLKPPGLATLAKLLITFIHALPFLFLSLSLFLSLVLLDLHPTIIFFTHLNFLIYFAFLFLSIVLVQKYSLITYISKMVLMWRLTFTSPFQSVFLILHSLCQKETTYK